MDIDFKWSYNPFAPDGVGNYQKTTMSFYLPVRSVVRISIYNLSGRLVRVLLEEDLFPGPINVECDGRDDKEKYVPIGVYIFQVEGVGEVRKGTITVLR